MGVKSQNTLHLGIVERNLNPKPKILSVPALLIIHISSLHSAAVYRKRALAFREALPTWVQAFVIWEVRVGTSCAGWVP